MSQGRNHTKNSTMCISIPKKWNKMLKQNSKKNWMENQHNYDELSKSHEYTHSTKTTLTVQQSIFNKTNLFFCFKKKLYKSWNFPSFFLFSNICFSNNFIVFFLYLQTILWNRVENTFCMKMAKQAEKILFIFIFIYFIDFYQLLFE